MATKFFKSHYKKFIELLQLVWSVLGSIGLIPVLQVYGPHLTCTKKELNQYFSVIIWLASQAGKMKRILCSDWLPEQAKWAYLARLGLPALFPQSWCNLLAI